MNRPLNWYVTIDYGWFDEGDELKPSQLHRDVRRRFWSWWNYKRQKGLVSGSLMDVVIWEAPNGKHHANWLMQIPPSLMEEAQAVIENRCAKVIDAIAHDTIHQQTIYNVNGVVSYLLKGTEPDYAEKIGVTPRYQGKVWCRRAVASMALGKSARDQDWRSGSVVNADRTRNLPMPREKRVLERESA